MAEDLKPTVANRQDESNVATGQPSYRGYDYQILATVWLGLELCISRKTEAIIVEPASQEDVAANLDVTAESANGHVVSANLQVQIKLRNNKLLTETDFKHLIEARVATGTRGPTPRERPLEKIRKDLACRFALITNAEVERDLNPFAVNEVGQESAAKRLPGSINDEPSIAQRLAILPGQKPALLEHQIKHILQDQCHVPGSRLTDCIHALNDRVKQRLLGNLANRLPSHEIQEVIRKHEGSFGSFDEPVHPSNFGRLRAQLLEKNALLLVGPPGTGKTTLAISLMSELETGRPPAQRMTVLNAASIAIVRQSLSDPYDHVYYFEDPWGQDIPNETASVFTAELPKLMRNARSGKRFVVTSRLGVFQSAVKGREDLFKRYQQELHPKDYDRSSYKELYERQIVDWPRNRKETAREIQTEALKLLETPYAVEIFCQELFHLIERGELLYANLIEQLARDSNVGSFGVVLKDRVIAGGEGCIRSAIAIWAQLAVASEKTNADEIRRLREILRSGGMSDPPDVLGIGASGFVGGFFIGSNVIVMWQGASDQV